MTARAPTLMLYDDRAEIALRQLEKIIHGAIWLADSVVLPEYAQPDPLAGDEEREFVARRLAELAEAGLLQRWRLEPELVQVSRARWWPEATRTHQVDATMNAALQRGIHAGVSLYRDEMLRGGGRPGGTMVSGISEFVSLHNSLWTVGLAKHLGTEYLLSSDSRSIALSSPFRRLVDMGRVAGPVSKTIMELHDIGPLTFLSSADIMQLRKYKPAVRSVIADIIRDVDDGNVLASLDFQAYVDAAVEQTRRYYVDLLGNTIAQMNRNSTVNNLAGMSLTIAGTIFPPLASLSYLQPLMSLNPQCRSRRKLVLFLAKLKKRTARREIGR